MRRIYFTILLLCSSCAIKKGPHLAASDVEAVKPAELRPLRPVSEKIADLRANFLALAQELDASNNPSAADLSTLAKNAAALSDEQIATVIQGPYADSVGNAILDPGSDLPAALRKTETTSAIGVLFTLGILSTAGTLWTFKPMRVNSLTSGLIGISALIAGSLLLDGNSDKPALANLGISAGSIAIAMAIFSATFEMYYTNYSWGDTAIYKYDSSDRARYTEVIKDLEDRIKWYKRIGYDHKAEYLASILTNYQYTLNRLESEAASKYAEYRIKRLKYDKAVAANEAELNAYNEKVTAYYARRIAYQEQVEKSSQDFVNSQRTYEAALRARNAVEQETWAQFTKDKAAYEARKDAIEKYPSRKQAFLEYQAKKIQFLQAEELYDKEEKRRSVAKAEYEKTVAEFIRDHKPEYEAYRDFLEAQKRYEAEFAAYRARPSQSPLASIEPGQQLAKLIAAANSGEPGKYLKTLSPEFQSQIPKTLDEVTSDTVEEVVKNLYLRFSNDKTKAFFRSNLFPFEDWKANTPDIQKILERQYEIKYEEFITEKYNETDFYLIHTGAVNLRKSAKDMKKKLAGYTAPKGPSAPTPVAVPVGLPKEPQFPPHTKPTPPIEVQDPGFMPTSLPEPIWFDYAKRIPSVPPQPVQKTVPAFNEYQPQKKYVYVPQEPAPVKDPGAQHDYGESTFNYRDADKARSSRIIGAFGNIAAASVLIGISTMIQTQPSASEPATAALSSESKDSAITLRLKTINAILEEP